MLSLAACGTTGVRNPESAEAGRAAVSRALAEVAGRVAVSKPGVKVCKRISVGISEHEWIRGTVMEADADKIRVRIDDPGRFPQAHDGTAIARGAVVWDKPLQWTPCT